MGIATSEVVRLRVWEYRFPVSIRGMSVWMGEFAVLEYYSTVSMC
jgi:hypothetical protein